jgi:hypothetical protein
MNTPIPLRPIVNRSIHVDVAHVHTSTASPGAPDNSTPTGLTTHAPLQPGTQALGTCTLVGAGPGDPELLTVKAVRAIGQATVLLVDDLVSDDIVALAPPKRAWCTWANVGAASPHLRRSLKNSWFRRCTAASGWCA